MAFNIYKEYETDQTAEVEGIKYELRDGVHLLLARAGGANIDGRRAIERALSPFKGHGGNPATGKPADSPAGQAALAAVVAKHIILGWDGIADKDGKKITYSVANATKLLNDLPELTNEITAVAMDMRNFQREAIEEDAKS